MSKPTSFNHTNSELTMMNRVVTGLRWGLLWASILSVILFMALPVFSLKMVIAISMITIICITFGIYRHWGAVRQPCPNCETVFIAMPQGSRCPNCGQRVHVEKGQMVKVA